ncbi:hypothetical protein FN846DRAFT_888482 [Sphaerosporella brunnea]|uniref:Uncharacterized protein n=1 Tax=Sphaerosporella brunnea TaxID=1250544 RepID=A0A5J5F2Y8_9PEZI|nr:hypothetical protein FN846DRAFT_888482 [Sphaerosporella brunnea]
MSHQPTEHDSRSATSIHDRIATFLRAPFMDEVDLVLHVEHDVYLSWPTTGLLAICSRSCFPTYSYDPATCTLRISGCNYPIHESILTYVAQLFDAIDQRDWHYAGVPVDLAVKGRVDWQSYCSYKAPPGQSPPWPAWRRLPDAVASFRCRDSRPCGKPAQGVVFEVGFAESYEELVADAFQWLLMEPGVQLVVLIKVHEDRSSCAPTPESQRRIDEYIWRFGNRRARTLLKAKPEFAGRDISVREEGLPCDSDSDWEVYDEIIETVRADDWVGPMSAFVEFWRLRDGKPDVDGIRMSLLPHLHVDNPLIYITDLLPSQERCDLQVTFDLAEYRRKLEDAIQQLAASRALDQCSLEPPQEPITADVLLKEYNISDNASPTGETQGDYQEMDSGDGDGDGAVA